MVIFFFQTLYTFGAIYGTQIGDVLFEKQ